MSAAALSRCSRRVNPEQFACAQSCGSQILRFALWLAAYVVMGLVLAIFVQSLGNCLLS